jgi:hypothetical protein
LKRVADLLEHFATRWERTREDPEAQRELVKLIVERVHIDGEAVVAMTLRSIYNLVLGYNANGPTEFTVDPFSCATAGATGVNPQCGILTGPKNMSGVVSLY